MSRSAAAAPADPSTTRRAHAAMAAYAFLIATSFPVGAAITASLDPVAVTWGRFLVASLLFAGLVTVKERLARPSLAALARYLAIGSTLAVFFVAMFEALRWTSPVNTGALFVTMPLISGFFAYVLMRQRVPRRQLLYMAIAAAGAAWIVFDGSLANMLALRLGRGEWIFLAGCLSFGLYAPLIRFFHRGESTLTMTFWTLVGGLTTLTVIGAPRLLAVDWTAVPAATYGGILYLAVFTTAVTFTIASFASVVLPAAKVMSYTYLTPAFVVALQAAFGAGLPSPSLLAGLVATTAATVLLQRA